MFRPASLISHEEGKTGPLQGRPASEMLCPSQGGQPQDPMVCCGCESLLQARAGVTAGPTAGESKLGHFSLVLLVPAQSKGAAGSGKGGPPYPLEEVGRCLARGAVPAQRAQWGDGAHEVAMEGSHKGGQGRAWLGTRELGGSGLYMGRVLSFSRVLISSSSIGGLVSSSII